jgi:hypothetical protein
MKKPYLIGQFLISVNCICYEVLADPYEIRSATPTFDAFLQVLQEGNMLVIKQFLLELHTTCANSFSVCHN